MIYLTSYLFKQNSCIDHNYRQDISATGAALLNDKAWHTQGEIQNSIFFSFENNIISGIISILSHGNCPTGISLFNGNFQQY